MMDFSSFEENPSWLVEDIREMMESKKTKYLSEDPSSSSSSSKTAKNIRLLKARMNPDKNDLYKHFGKERATPSSTRRMKLTDFQGDLEGESPNEATIKEFLTIIQKQNEDKMQKHQEFMKRSLYHPNPAMLPTLPRKWSPTRPRSPGARVDGTYPFASTTIRPLSPPKSSRDNSPTINFHEKFQQEMKLSRKSESTPKISTQVQTKMLVFIKSVLYYKHVFERTREYKLLQLKMNRASIRIQRGFRRMQTKTSLQKYLQVPSLFTRWLYRYKRRRALGIVASFIRDVQNAKTKRIVRRFLMAVKKVQTYIRQYLEVRDARVLMLTIYWEKLEVEIRRQIEETERANYARNEKLRLKRMGKNIHSSSIFEKWNMTHHQVQALYGHIDDVEVSRANVIRLNEGGKRSKTRHHDHKLAQDDKNVFMEMCDPALVRDSIRAHLLYKRRVHLEQLREAEESSGARQTRDHMARIRAFQELNSSLLPLNPLGEESTSQSGERERGKEAARHEYINVKVVKKVLKDFSAKNTKDLLSRQLAEAGIDVEEEERARRARHMVETASSKYKVQQPTMRLENFGRKEKENKQARIFQVKTFFLLTGSLGKSWKAFIEEVVRAETQRKKKLLQQENERSIQESMRTQQERAKEQRRLALRSKQQGHLAAASTSVESLEGSESSAPRRRSVVPTRSSSKLPATVPRPASADSASSSRHLLELELGQGQGQRQGSLHRGGVVGIERKASPSRSQR